MRLVKQTDEINTTLFVYIYPGCDIDPSDMLPESDEDFEVLTAPDLEEIGTPMIEDVELELYATICPGDVVPERVKFKMQTPQKPYIW